MRRSLTLVPVVLLVGCGGGGSPSGPAQHPACAGAMGGIECHRRNPTLTNMGRLAVALVVVESIVLVSAGWRCPLTILAERRGTTQGAVADIFLPRWFVERIFPICGTIFLVACAILVARLVAP